MTCSMCKDYISPPTDDYSLCMGEMYCGCKCHREFKTKADIEKANVGKFKRNKI